MSRITAPFSPDQVAALNAYQRCGLAHEFTCGAESCRAVLVATEAGWSCPRCDYTQDWAHEDMADPKWICLAAIMERGVDRSAAGLAMLIGGNGSQT